ncbi:MAG: hypothetical protein HUJ26_10390 [Planctomycetaceae bacterium]|nr:hypothetical protein [Planctomycetaceae bacterium]
MKNLSTLVLFVSICALHDAARGQSWNPPQYQGETYGLTEDDSSSQDDLTWMTLDRNGGERPPFASEQQIASLDPAVRPVGAQATGNPTFAPASQANYEQDVQDTGYSTLDLLPNELPPQAPPQRPAGAPASLLTAAFDARWEPKENGLGVTQLFIGVKKPLAMPLFGGPPPVVSFNFGMTDLRGSALGEFYDFSIGINWIKPVNQRWTWLFSLRPGIATDFENTSSDMWRFRGHALGIYAVSPMTQWIFGAVATGRADLPILPAVGLIWWPDENVKVDLTFPRPKISWPIATDGDREHWMYLGGELGGGTWAVGLPGGVNDTLTYRTYRIALGIEFLPAGARRPGAQPVTSDTAYVELGVSSGRELEFDELGSSFDRDSVFYLGGGVQF